MGRQIAVVLYAVAMAALIVGVDLAFFRSRFWERLTANIGIVLVFAAFYWRFLRRPWTRRDSVSAQRSVTQAFPTFPLLCALPRLCL